MSQRVSGYVRKERDLYETPEWVTEALLPHLPTFKYGWEPAAASGKIVSVLRKAGYEILASDISTGEDFFNNNPPIEGIITNPPFELATEFIERSIRLTRPDGFVAMLLRTDFDHAKTRTHIFGGCKQFSKKLVLTKRIVWFEPKIASPSVNHAWFIWNWKHSGPPTLAYH